MLAAPVRSPGAVRVTTAGLEKASGVVILLGGNGTHVPGLVEQGGHIEACVVFGIPLCPACLS